MKAANMVAGLPVGSFAGWSVGFVVVSMRVAPNTLGLMASPFAPDTFLFAMLGGWVGLAIGLSVKTSPAERSQETVAGETSPVRELDRTDEEAGARNEAVAMRRLGGTYAEIARKLRLSEEAVKEAVARDEAVAMRRLGGTYAEIARKLRLSEEAVKLLLKDA